MLLHTYDPIHKSHRDSRDGLGYRETQLQSGTFSQSCLVFFLNMYGCLAGICPCVPYAAYGGQNLGVGPPGIVSTYGCELPCGCWEQNPGSQQEQAMLLTPDPCFKI